MRGPDMMMVNRADWLVSMVERSSMPPCRNLE
jgi:hypothetical protein